MAASAKKLGRKWGLPNIDQLSDSGEDRRMMCTCTKLARAGALTLVPDDLVYRGHDGMRIKNLHKVKQTDAAMLMSDGEPAAPSAGAPVVETSLPGGEPATSSTGAPTGILHSDSEPFAFSSGAPVVKDSGDNGEPAAHNTGAPIKDTLQSEAETAARAASSHPEGPEVATPDGWKLVVAGPKAQLSPLKVLSVATKFFPLWFDICENGDEDLYGPIPRDWLFSYNTTPVLPYIKIDSSLSNKFWSEIDSSDEEHDLQHAIQASITTAVEEREKHKQQKGVAAMALIIKMDLDNEDPQATETAGRDSDDEGRNVPNGLDGRYTSKQKGKAVPRTKDQCEFLHQYVSGMHAERKKNKPMPSLGKGRAPQGPVQFKRKPSLMPNGGWFQMPTVAGGHGPPQGPPSSSSSSSDLDSSSSNSSSEILQTALVNTDI